DNAAARAVLKQAFGTRYAESKTGDLWQQDGYEIGYARTPTGQMPIVLELPRARNGLFDTVNTMRTFIRGSLLAAGVGVNIELASQLIVSASSFGGDIESLPRPGAAAGAPGFLLASGMPTYMKDFFAAQGVNPLLDLKLDDWLGIAHVDEVVQLASNGNKLLIADPDLAWALALWATKLDPNVRMLPKMDSNEGLPDYTAEGIKASLFLNNATFRKQNLQFAQSSSRLRGVYDAVKKAMKLTDELSAPLKWGSATGTVSLLRGGAFTGMIGNVKRTFQVKFLDGDRYQLQYRDEGGAYSKWFEGRKSRDEVFTDAKAFLLKEYWTGTAKAGDRFTFTTNPAATLIKMPVLFATFGLLFDPPGSPPPVQPWRLGAFTTNHINSIVDGQTVVTGGSYGPRVNFDGSGVKKDLFDAYAIAAFRAAGFTKIFFADARLYHDSSGSLHCGTNVIRTMLSAKWWEA
ncbi:MAG: protein-arginine deiminase, partial [Humisphaera sp.]|nr:protein-arginine deiminase [Humisphaera sp.]